MLGNSGSGVVSFHHRRCTFHVRNGIPRRGVVIERCRARETEKGLV